MTPVGIYTRLSKDPTGRKPNIADQERRCRDLATGRGWTVAEVYVDRDRTAAGRDPYRPAYAEMIDDLRAGKIRGIVALDQDRLVREPFELETLLRLCEDVGTNAVATSEGDITPENLLMVRIRAAVAAEEVAKTKKRQKRAQERIALAGQYGGGLRSYGWNADKTAVVPEEADRLRDAAARIIAGESAATIVNEWNAAGVPTATGKGKWRGTVLRRLLQSPGIAGLREFRGETIGDAAWPEILDRATYEAVKLAISSKPQAKLGGKPHTYLLSGGLARCGKCGAKLRGRPTRGVRGYFCVKEEEGNGCGGIAVNAAKLDALVTDAVFTAIDAGALDRIRQAEAKVNPDAAVALESLKAAEQRLESVEEKYLLGDVGRPAYVKVRDAITLEIEGYRRTLAAASSQALSASLPDATEELAQWYRAASVERRRAFLSLFLEAVRVKPAAHRGEHFTARRCEITWRI